MKKNLPCLICILLLAAGNVFGQADAGNKEKNNMGPVVEMEPYVVKSDRILPDPEQWHYMKVPALMLTRGNRNIIAPGYEMLSNLNPKQTKTLVDELQLRQFAAAYLWPMLTQVLPRTPIYVVVDINQQRGAPFQAPVSIDTWEREKIEVANVQPSPSNFNSSHNYGGVAGAQRFAAEYGLSQADDINAGLIETGEADITEADDLAQLGARKSQEYVEDETTVKPLGDGYVILASNGGGLAMLIRAGEQFAGEGRPTEEQFAATMSYELSLYALKTLPQKTPAWFARGLSSLLGSTQVSYKLIRFAFIRENLANSEMPKLARLFSKEGVYTAEEAKLASLFVHFGLFGEYGKFAPNFTQFVNRLGNGEQPTEVMFNEVFGISMSRMETYLAVYARDIAAFSSTEISGKLPSMPKFIYREATQSEVARIKGEMYVAQANPGKALEELRTAYWRGEREPGMLALLAALELQIGAEPRARKIIKALMELPAPPPQTYIAAARLQFKDALAAKPADAKLTLTEEETNALVGTLSGALAGGLTTEDLCGTLAEIIIKSSTRPDPNMLAFLEQASKRYPKNQNILEALKLRGS